MGPLNEQLVEDNQIEWLFVPTDPRSRRESGRV
jgi:hypothetical protein